LISCRAYPALAFAWAAQNFRIGSDTLAGHRDVSPDTAYLSVALVPTAMDTGSSPVQALMFHFGDYVGSPTGSGVGVPRIE
jgi:hypothetical protein